jgi:hypothetical protein
MIFLIGKIRTPKYYTEKILRLLISNHSTVMSYLHHRLTLQGVYGYTFTWLSLDMDLPGLCRFNAGVKGNNVPWNKCQGNKRLRLLHNDLNLRSLVSMALYLNPSTNKRLGHFSKGDNHCFYTGISSLRQLREVDLDGSSMQKVIKIEKFLILQFWQTLSARRSNTCGDKKN